ALRQLGAVDRAAYDAVAHIPPRATRSRRSPAALACAAGLCGGEHRRPHPPDARRPRHRGSRPRQPARPRGRAQRPGVRGYPGVPPGLLLAAGDRKSTRLNSSHITISYAVFCLKKKKKKKKKFKENLNKKKNKK